MMNKEEILTKIEKLESEQIQLEKKCKMFPKKYDNQLEFNIVEKQKLYRKLERVI